MAGESQRSIVFFDGTCGFCDRSVTFLFRQDHRHRLRFAPLQGETARRYLSEAQRTDLNTLVFWQDGLSYERSTAALRALQTAGGVWHLVALLLLLVPSAVRDWGYDWVARHRYRLFGRSEACRLPTLAERQYFLD